MQLHEIVQHLLTKYLNKFSSIQAIKHDLGEGVQLRTQAPIQTSKFGRNKFNFGYETVWLQVQLPSKYTVPLARLSQVKGGIEFEVLALEEHKDLIVKNLPKIQEIAT